MNTPEYIAWQFKNLNGVLHHIAGDITEAEWMARPGSGQNTLGYSIWHIVRTQDHFLNSWILGRDEIVAGPRWRHWSHLKPFGVGIGITLENSDEIARSTNLAEVFDYVDEVHAAFLKWLADLDENTLDLIPNAAEYLRAFPEYQTPGFHAETDDLLGLPVWGLLMRPCMGHVHRHLGEVEITKDVLRKRK